MGSITHKFNNAHADGADATLVRPSNWNDTHNFTLAAADISGLAASATTDTTNANNISSGTLAVARGGTNASTGRGAASSLAVAYILAKSGLPVSGAADTNENVLTTVTIPAGAMGANGVVVLEFSTLWTASANNKTWRVRLNGVAGTQLFSEVVTTGGAGGRFARVVITNTNSASAQISAILNGSSGGVALTNNVASAIDTTAAVDLVITCVKATAGETVTVNAYNCLLLANGS